MNILRYLIVTLFLGQNLFIFGQIDFDDAFSEKNGFDKILLAEALKDRYLNTDLDSLKLLSVFLMDEKSELFFLGVRYHGSYLSRKGEFSEAIRLLDLSYGHFEAAGNFRNVSEILNEIGNVHLQLSNTAEASNNYLESLKFGAMSGDRTAEFNGILGLGKVLCVDGDTLLGIRLSSYFLKACLEERKYQSAADACAFLGMIFSELGDKQVAKMYYKQSIEYAKKSKSRTHLANALTNQAIVDVGNSDMKMAEKNFVLAAKHREELGVKKTIIDAYFNLGSFYIMTERFDEARDYLLRASKLAEESGMIRDEYDAIEVVLLALPKKVISKDRKELESRFEILKELLANKKEISFEVRGLSTQIAKSGSIEVLNVQKIDRVFWLWFGFFTVLTVCSIVYYFNRPKKMGQLSL